MTAAAESRAADAGGVQTEATKHERRAGHLLSEIRTGPSRQVSPGPEDFRTRALSNSKLPNKPGTRSKPCRLLFQFVEKPDHECNQRNDHNAGNNDPLQGERIHVYVLWCSIGSRLFVRLKVLQMKVAGAEEPAKTNKIKLIATRDFGEPARGALVSGCTDRQQGFRTRQRLARISAEVSTLLTSLTFPATSLTWSIAFWLVRVPVSATTP